MAMEVYCNSCNRDILCSMMQVIAVETALASAKSLPYLIGMMTSQSANSSILQLEADRIQGLDDALDVPVIKKGRQCAGGAESNGKNRTEVPDENKDDGETDDDDEDEDEDDDHDDDGGNEDDLSGEEGNENEGDDAEDDVEANGDGGSDDDDEDDDDDDDDEDGDEDDEDDEEDEEEDEEIPEPPTKKRK
ncbi:prostatic spermine-binding protein [Amborella trichopoda]|uniref:Uncharacterized protein n=1 Tax=Amborella trichopoda TaxID=13333 RepID=U5D1Q7_AMBTC|nr:prostatic spermine-binding protein [Amborella trichopoda]ERN14298.1 hypothetical protein AMTR_s00033p00185390 [Amborella trichopoda]|eukprot:XP_006852831.1 prostatic spermine-binding protein [Amborella trichopoda]